MIQRREFLGASGAMLALSLITPSAARSQPTGQPLPAATDKPPQLTLRDITIGQGSPKVIVPTTASHPADVLTFVDKVASSQDFHVLELRLDMLENALDANAMAALTHQVRDRLGNKLLLLTFRTQDEGGKKAVSDEQYVQLYQQLLAEGTADLIDVEMYRDRTKTDPLIALAHQRGVKVILSNHELKSTPAKEEIVSRLREQQARGADILKLAAMPADPGDVLTLLTATWEMHQHYAQRPVLTMSMGDLGVLTRMSGELTGSALTFAMVGEASASGQVALEDLSSVLGIVHKSMGS
ncbi:type I 3-dehydroquinate dehydratase [Erwinia sp. ErVv1]|uniref:type I 3-dehydroquinate dehydratase n=1 Tax=Erwinia sp. ErVv1 TaxID=1603299 RepID=UPI000B106E1E|nr:type I 3-dehydroquinate dehydratase [Erwinia sp. ErVv1]